MKFADNHKDENMWQEKRLEILKRDNYTCQCCHTFNPQLGMVEIYRPDDMSLELHMYESSPGNSTYILSSEKTGMTLTMEFGETWLVLPVMQVHHKKYIENREKWDYDNADLITLCKECHTLIHENIKIPLFDEKGVMISKKKYLPVDTGCGHAHNIAPWNFIKFQYKSGYKREYKLSEIQATLSFFMLDSEEKGFFEKEEVLNEGVKAYDIYEDFLKRFLPQYIRQDKL